MPQRDGPVRGNLRNLFPAGTPEDGAGPKAEEAAIVAPTTKPGRVLCIVPGCRRTCPADRYTEFACTKHWPLADRRWRRLHGKIVRKGKRDGWPGRLVRLENRVWLRIKSQVIERALGCG